MTSIDNPSVLIPNGVPAYSEVIHRHIPLVHKMARRMAARVSAGIGADDLFSAGALGLVDSVIRNRGEEGQSFACYVKMRIRGAIYDELRATSWRPRRNKNRENTSDGCVLRPPTAIVHLEDLVTGPDAQPQNRARGSDPHEALSEKRERETLHKALGELAERDRMVVHLHYFRGMQFREISRFLGVSEARVSQIHHRALKRIRPLLETAA